MAAELYGKPIAQISSPTATQDYFYFSLIGVSKVDPIVPGAAWIAVPRSHSGFKAVALITGPD